MNNTQSYFDKVSKNYTKNSKKYPMKFIKDSEIFTINHLFNIYLQKDDAVLEVGAGSGIYTEILQSKSISLELLDNSEEMCKLLRSKFPKIPVYNQEVTSIQRGKQYNSIVAIGLIEFIEDLDSLFLSLHKSLNKNGVVILSYTKVSFLSFLFKAFHIKNRIRIYLRSRNQINKVLKRNHFKIIHEDTICNFTGIMVIGHE